MNIPFSGRLLRYAYRNTPLFGSNFHYTRFVLLAQQRTGSTMLGTCIKSHPQAHCFSELLNRKEPMFFSDGLRNSDPILKAFRNRFPSAFINEFIFGGYNDRLKAIGFQLFPEHVRNTRFTNIWQALVADPSVSFIHLKRRNKLAAEISRQKAIQTGEWSRSGNSRSGTGKLQLDPQTVVRGMLEREKGEAFFDASLRGARSIAVTYEDVLTQMDNEMSKLQAFLGIEETALATPLERQAPGELWEQLDDPESLERAIAHRPDWAAMLHG